MPSILLLGATGYIGGSVLAGLRAAHPAAPVTALARRAADVAPLRAAGAAAVVLAAHDDLERIRAAAALADVVVNAADADDLPLAKALLAGLAARARSGAAQLPRPVLIHTSGTGVVADDAAGEFQESGRRIWNDNVEDDIRAIPPEKPHRLVDLEIFQADAHKEISAYIIAPSTVFGTGLGPVKKLSAQIPTAVRTAVRRKEAVYIGKGTNKWMNVHINDLVDLYLLVLKRALAGTDDAAGAGPHAKFFFGSVDEHVWGEIIAHIGTILHERAVLPRAAARSVSLAEEPGLQWTANNSRTAADRAFSIGWRPKAKSIEDTLEEDVAATLAADSK